MNFNTIFLKSFRVLLLPIALLYGWVIKIRNVFYDKNWFASSQFHFPVIAIGNLAVGGTGKSPMVEYLMGVLHPAFRIAILSRGYKRKTKGYVLAKSTTTALEIGDEPMQFHLKYPELPVAVCEERLVGIPYLLQDVPDLQAIVLDDAFQHRDVVPGLNILLTEYANLYAQDYFLPTGDLRDERSRISGFFLLLLPMVHLIIFSILPTSGILPNGMKCYWFVELPIQPRLRLIS
ncbi:MAG: tetraacyldisaccharide 4'-kinase [Bacteroidetes bacterium]|nr:tetraacyldisaccharide 4'-kinase [Bacteroidota bacterium]